MYVAPIVNDDCRHVNDGFEVGCFNLGMERILKPRHEYDSSRNLVRINLPYQARKVWGTSSGLASSEDVEKVPTTYRFFNEISRTIN